MICSVDPHPKQGFRTPPLPSPPFPLLYPCLRIHLCRGCCHAHRPCRNFSLYPCPVAITLRVPETRHRRNGILGIPLPSFLPPPLSDVVRLLVVVVVVVVLSSSDLASHGRAFAKFLICILTFSSNSPAPPLKFHPNQQHKNPGSSPERLSASWRYNTATCHFARRDFDVLCLELHKLNLPCVNIHLRRHGNPHCHRDGFDARRKGSWVQ